LLWVNPGVTRTLSIQPFSEKNSAATRKKEKFWRPSVAPHQPLLLQYLTVLSSLILVTVAAFVFTPIVGPHATALVYLLMVVVLSLVMNRGPAFIAGALSAVCWDFFFLPPTFAFAIHSFEDGMFFAMYFVVALALGQLTSRIRAQQKLEQQARFLGESERLSKTMLDSMSHELRTPIAAIQSAVGNLVEWENAGLSGFQREMIEEIIEATERLHRLVGNALEISRLESGAVRPNLTNCDPAELVHMSVSATEKKLAGHPVRVIIERDLPMAQLDFVLMQETLINLLSNTASHTPPGTPVEVSVYVEQGSLVFQISDRGPGIDLKALPRIFDKFYRASTAPAGGTGLGLSLVKGFVEAQGGTVCATNRAGGGAVFTVRMPLRQNAVIAQPSLKGESA
jgi:two-component system sensor histidine kinase KdpD